MSNDYLMVFVKNLIPGTVKTRLVKDIGMDGAFDVYKELLDYTAEIANKCININKAVFYSEYVDRYDDWDNDHYEKYIQHGDGLGERMMNAFEQSFDKGMENVVLIGSDNLEIEKSHIQEAFTALKKNDLVFGPAADGGYYLVGMKNIFPALFEDKTYSHGQVLNQALDEADKFGLSYHLLDTLHDIDTMEDLKRAGYEIIIEDDPAENGDSIGGI